jgi:homoserine O-acetyltransferase
MSDFEIFEVPNFLLQKGGILPAARLAYATRGALNPARDNAVLVPSWYTGTHDDSEMFMLGEGRALDPDKYFIILTNFLPTACRPRRVTARRPWSAVVFRR